MSGSFVVVRWVDARAARRVFHERTGRTVQLMLSRWMACPADDERAPRAVAGVGGRRGRARFASIMRGHMAAEKGHLAPRKTQRWWNIVTPAECLGWEPIGRRERRRLQRHVRRERDRLVRETAGNLVNYRDQRIRKRIVHLGGLLTKRYGADRAFVCLIAWLDGGRPRGAARARSWRQGQRAALLASRGAS